MFTRPVVGVCPKCGTGACGKSAAHSYLPVAFLRADLLSGYFNQTYTQPLTALGAQLERISEIADAEIADGLLGDQPLDDARLLPSEKIDGDEPVTNGIHPARKLPIGAAPVLDPVG
jgi:hypothetical protein